MPEKRSLTIAVDQGTSSTKGVVVDDRGRIVAVRSVAVSQSHPRPGWVEQDAREILDSVTGLLRDLGGEYGDATAGLGLSTQRESALVWDRATGRSLGPMLGWQDRRTTDRARELIAEGTADDVRRRTGLPLDPMFSALKLQWLLDEVDPDRRRSKAGELAVGTVDSWLLFHLTGAHRIEAGNASRTQLLNVATTAWDPDLLTLFGIPEAVLPEVVDSDDPIGVRGAFGLAAALPVAAVLADSHAALYGHGVRAPGSVKATYGTGSSIMGLAPSGADAPSGLATTIAWRLSGRTAHAFEGNILSTGATLVWLAGILGVEVGELTALAETVGPLHGVDLVPAFAGLAAPWWNEDAEAVIRGFTLGTTRAELARAATDSVVLQVEDVLAAIEQAGAPVAEVLVDGGPSANDWLVQQQADLSQRSVRRSNVPELSAYGVALLAAETLGIDRVEPADGDTFSPRLDPATAAERRARWHRAVASALAEASPSSNRALASSHPLASSHALASTHAKEHTNVR